MDWAAYFRPTWQKAVMALLIGLALAFAVFVSLREQAGASLLPALLLGIAFSYLAACALVFRFFAQTRGITQKFNEFWMPTLPKIMASLALFLLFAPLLSYDNGKICPPCASGEACACQTTTAMAAYIELPFHPERDYHIFNILNPAVWAGIALFAAGAYIIACYFFAHYFSLIPKMPSSGHADPMKNSHPSVKAILYSALGVVLLVLAAIAYLLSGAKSELFLFGAIAGGSLLLLALWNGFLGILTPRAKA